MNLWASNKRRERLLGLARRVLCLSIVQHITHYISYTHYQLLHIILAILVQHSTLHIIQSGSWGQRGGSCACDPPTHAYISTIIQYIIVYYSIVQYMLYISCIYSIMIYNMYYDTYIYICITCIHIIMYTYIYIYIYIYNMYTYNYAYIYIYIYIYRPAIAAATRP